MIQILWYFLLKYSYSLKVISNVCVLGCIELFPKVIPNTLNTGGDIVNNNKKGFYVETVWSNNPDSSDDDEDFDGYLSSGLEYSDMETDESTEDESSEENFV